ncbi:phosphorylase [Trinickia caryophylli]|uniref:ATP adenylyltransferase n=1 Tax=Trinickia caryophylli TaxID=28094 RepID=A0A1X7CW82_TRICW|nr:phosphorylase [Trinickia caryophylli]PMS13428.1 phosphorylase [Trinickia caryophylli]TRX13713.1 phosphorylase [Trinickia caryophylli]WQE15301.1 phosphorylase [Trinickia caryophylli]SMF04212.1 ATP adenylyltransferase [Trinickia caryophylli]GLU30947.1 ATP adenylyltransferase [Trinickia caryophylli]
MSSPSPQPGWLQRAIVERARHALACGALQPIETSLATIDDGGVRFAVRQVSSLVRKARERPAARGDDFDPFLPYDPDLFVADLSPTHVALLNKFNVIDHHLLIVTRAFEDQETLLGLADFEAWNLCLQALDGWLGFYNGGVQAGASQRHKHMQAVAPALGEAGMPLPIAPLLDAAPRDGRVCTVAGLPFAHAFCRLTSERGEAAPAMLAAYRRLLDTLGVSALASPADARQSAPYNLLVTSRWMLAVPRTAESAEGVAVNALGFAGSLFVRDATQMEAVRRVGPLRLLQRVARPLAGGNRGSSGG